MTKSPRRNYKKIVSLENLHTSRFPTRSDVPDDITRGDDIIFSSDSRSRHRGLELRVRVRVLFFQFTSWWYIIAFGVVALELQRDFKTVSSEYCA